MNKCEHATSDQVYVRDEDGYVIVIWCKGCGEELCRSLSCQGPWFRDHDKAECK